MLGVAYYHEHWDFERIEKDIEIMSGNGIKIIRIGEFMWDKLEPEEGNYDFSILDKVFESAEKNGIKIILGTPSATPPAWIIRKYPDILQKDENGNVRNFGSRRHYCYNSDNYKQYIKEIVEKLAERYGIREGLYAWQIDNEFGCENTTHCYCEKCDSEFTRFLAVKYGDIKKLNEAWGTSFWSQTYNSFSQIETPKKTNAFPNPHHVIDYYRFSTESINNYAKAQVDIIRKYSDRPVTHNFMVNFTDINYKDHEKIYDFISYDSYMPKEEFDPMLTAFNFDLMYAIKNKEFTVMEQQPGRVNWQTRNLYYPAKWLLPVTFQAKLHGASDLLYFRYRAVPYGAEQFHNGILNYDGKPEKSERLKLIKRMSKEYDSLNKIKNADTALYFDYEVSWMHKINNVSKDFNYINSVIDVYSAVKKLNREADIVFYDSDISNYKYIIVPFAVYLSDEFKRKTENFQGKILITAMTDLKDVNNHILKTTGINMKGLKLEIKDFGAVYSKKINYKNYEIKGDYWIEEIVPSEGKITGYWENEMVASVESEDGKVIYTGFVTDRDGYVKILSDFFGEDKITEDGLELTGEYVINYTDTEKDYGKIKLQPYSIKKICE